MAPLPYIFFTNPVIIVTSPVLPPTPRFSMKSLFSNNAIVCYKNHSLPTSGAGTVRNSRWKGRHT